MQVPLGFVTFLILQLSSFHSISQESLVSLYPAFKAGHVEITRSCCFVPTLCRLKFWSVKFCNHTSRSALNQRTPSSPVESLAGAGSKAWRVTSSPGTWLGEGRLRRARTEQALGCGPSSADTGQGVLLPPAAEEAPSLCR